MLTALQTVNMKGGAGVLQTIIWAQRLSGCPPEKLVHCKLGPCHILGWPFQHPLLKTEAVYLSETLVKLVTDGISLTYVAHTTILPTSCYSDRARQFATCSSVKVLTACITDRKVYYSQEMRIESELKLLLYRVFRNYSRAYFSTRFLNENSAANDSSTDLDRQMQRYGKHIVYSVATSHSVLVGFH
jgi:hypothetical protein